MRWLFDYIVFVMILPCRFDFSFGGIPYGHEALLLLLTSREKFIQQTLSTIFLARDWTKASRSDGGDPFMYSSDWTGTSLALKSLDEAVQCAPSDRTASWPMARWPDPVLRHRASEVGPQYFGTNALRRACSLLRNTAEKERAVGLAAEQCGVDARIIFLAKTSHGFASPSVTMINPRVIERSPEAEMKAWREHCLVLPPAFTATVLRDAWIIVQYQDGDGHWHRLRLLGESARAFQHEFDHDRGILITDHVGFDEMDGGQMVAIESKGHDERMKIAYSRETQSQAGI